VPRISLYLDQETFERVKSAAARERLSVSKWVAEQIRPRVQTGYPPGFEELFGSIDDESFKRHETKHD
jgi:hypothetical protein